MLHIWILPVEVFLYSVGKTPAVVSIMVPPRSKSSTSYSNDPGGRVIPGGGFSPGSPAGLAAPGILRVERVHQVRAPHPCHEDALGRPLPHRPLLAAPQSADALLGDPRLAGEDLHPQVPLAPEQPVHRGHQG